MADYVTLKSLASELGVDRSYLRKYALKHGFDVIKVRSPETQGQQGLALTANDAESLRTLRGRQGFGVDPMAIENGHGHFYIVQVIPDVDPLRLKFGFATDVSGRLESHRCVSPTAEVIRSWPCRRSWEMAAIASVTRRGCRLIRNEVYTCDVVEDVVAQAEAFFDLMPDVS